MEPRYLNQIIADTSDLPRLVYADWLDEQGDPRGEFIRVQCELARTSPHEQRWADLFFRQRQLCHQLRRELAEWARPMTTLPPAKQNQSSFASVEWYRGMPESLQIDSHGLQHKDHDVLNEMPIRRLDMTHWPDTDEVKIDLGQPWMRRLEAFYTNGGPWLSEFLAHASFEQIVSLGVFDNHAQNWRCDAASLKKVEASLPHLQSLAMPFTDDGLEELFAGPLANRLTHLSIEDRFGGSPVPFEMIKRAMDEGKLTQLRQFNANLQFTRPEATLLLAIFGSPQESAQLDENGQLWLKSALLQQIDRWNFCGHLSHHLGSLAELEAKTPFAQMLGAQFNEISAQVATETSEPWFPNLRHLSVVPQLSQTAHDISGIEKLVPFSKLVWHTARRARCLGSLPHGALKNLVGVVLGGGAKQDLAHLVACGAERLCSLSLYDKKLTTKESANLCDGSLQHLCHLAVGEAMSQTFVRDLVASPLSDDLEIEFHGKSPLDEKQLAKLVERFPAMNIRSAAPANPAVSTLHEIRGAW